MRTLLCLLLIATTFNARAATYLLLSQTNALAQGITNQAKVYTDSVTNSTIAAATNSAKSYTDSHSGGGSAPVGTVVATGTNAAGMVLTAADDKGTNGVWSDPIFTNNGSGLISFGDPNYRLKTFSTNTSSSPAWQTEYDISGQTASFDLWDFYLYDAGGNTINAATAVMYFNQNLVTENSGSPLNYGTCNYGLEVDNSAIAGTTNCQQAGVFSSASGPVKVGYSFAALSQSAQNRVGYGGSATTDGATTSIGAYLETRSGAFASDRVLENSVLLLDNVDSGLPLLTARTNNGTTVFQLSSDGSIAAGTTNRWKTGDYFTNYVGLEVNGNATRLVTENNSGDVTIPGTLNVNTATFTNFTATHLTVSDITASNKLVSTSPTTTALTNGYAAAITNTWGIFTGNAQSVVDGTANLSAKGDIVTANIGTGTVTNNLSVALGSGITNYIDFTYATRTNAIGVPITFSFATNGVTGYELSHTRYFLNTGGSNLTLTIPSGWKTNMAQTVCAALTNGVTTVMYVKAIGDTSSSALQTNVYVSFEYYK